jgi:hypothetical protein
MDMPEGCDEVPRAPLITKPSCEEAGLGIVVGDSLPVLSFMTLLRLCALPGKLPSSAWLKLAFSGLDQRPPSPPAVAIAAVAGVLLLGLLLDVGLDDLLDVANLYQDVLGLQVGVDDAALAVQVVEAQQDLLRDLLDEGHGDAAVVPALDQAEQVLAEDLEDHADVDAIGALVVERVEQADDVGAARVVLLGVDDLFEQLDLVEGRLGVVGGGADNLEGDVLAGGIVARQPDGGEVAPAQLADNGVLAVLVLLADLDGVVAALAVVLAVLLVGRVVGLVDGAAVAVGRVAHGVTVRFVLLQRRRRGAGRVSTSTYYCKAAVGAVVRAGCGRRRAGLARAGSALKSVAPSVGAVVTVYEEGCWEETHPYCAPPCPSVVMIGFRSWPFRRFALPLLPLAACATAFALLMAAFLMSAPFIVGFPATRWPTVGGGVGRCGVRSGRVVDPRTPHRRKVESAVGVGYRELDVAICLLCLLSHRLRFLQLLRDRLSARLSGLSWHCAPDWWGAGAAAV